MRVTAATYSAVCSKPGGAAVVCGACWRLTDLGLELSRGGQSSPEVLELHGRQVFRELVLVTPP